jgi:hypothetical protein
MRQAKYLLIAALLCFAGCQDRFVDERTITFDKNADIRTLIVPATTGERTLYVTANSDNPIDVYVFLEEKQEEAERMITLQKPSDLVLAKAEHKTNVNLKATLPPNKSACVMIGTEGEEAEVELSMHD